MKSTPIRGVVVLCLLAACTTLGYGQAGTITGTVIDADNFPLPGVTVYEKGTTNGTTTDMEGQYSIDVSPGDTLVFSFIGYLTRELEVGEESVYDIDLSASSTDLDEIVVVAYGTQKRDEITSSVATVSGEELIDQAVPDPSTLLQGKAAGVQVTLNSGAPGSTPSILIRGATSLSGRIDPLWVVDGVIQPYVPVINPADIDNISVLKDASATALYGSRGANGVVIVTTKRGSGQGKINVRSRVGANHFNTGNFEIMNSEELYAYNEQFGNNQPWFGPELLNTDYNWLEGGTQTGIVQDHNVSFSGGGDKFSAYLNAGYYNETGTLRGNELDRYTFRMNLDYQVNDRFTVKPKIAYNFDSRDRVAQAPLWELFLNLPWDQPYDENGDPINAQQSQEWLGRDRRNYFYDQQWNYSTFSDYNFSSNLDFQFDITDNLSFLSTNNVTRYNGESSSYTDPRSTGGMAVQGQIYGYSGKSTNLLTTQVLKFERDFGSYGLTALGGYEYNEGQSTSVSSTGQGIVPGTEILNVTTTPSSVAGGRSEYALQSFFISTDHTFNDRYFAKLAIRRDGASNFGLENRYGTFFAIGGGWNIHNESFFRSEVVNTLKLRGSFGSVGNRPSANYPFQSTFTVGQQYLGVPAITLGQFGNPDLGWETTYETNLAVDIRLFRRFTGTVEVYNRETSDLLFFIGLPDLTGFSGYYENVGGVTNRGIEGSVAADIFSTDRFSWNLGFNINFNRNEITELFEGQDDVPQGSDKIFQVGEDYNSWFLRKWLGVDPQTGGPLWEVVDPQTGERSSTSDYNEATQQIVGTSTPKYFGGFNTGLRYGSLSLNANFTFSGGADIYNSARELFDSDGNYPTFNQQVLMDGWTRWQQPGDVVTHPLPMPGGNALASRPSTRYLEDGSYLRMTNVTLTYNLPATVMQRIGFLTNFSVYVAGDNLFTITDFSGVDPAVSGGLAGRSSLEYPIPKRLVVGLNTTF